MKVNWNTHRLSDGRWYANNGRLQIYANSLIRVQKLIRKYRYATGIMSQRITGEVSHRYMEDGRCQVIMIK